MGHFAQKQSGGRIGLPPGGEIFSQPGIVFARLHARLKSAFLRWGRFSGLPNDFEMDLLVGADVFRPNPRARARGAARKAARKLKFLI